MPQIAFKPDWTKHAKAAPFKRNDAMLAALPIGVMVFPGTGIQANLADKAKKLRLRCGNSATAGPDRLCEHFEGSLDQDEVLSNLEFALP